MRQLNQKSERSGGHLGDKMTIVSVHKTLLGAMLLAQTMNVAMFLKSPKLNPVFTTRVIYIRAKASLLIGLQRIQFKVHLYRSECKSDVAPGGVTENATECLHQGATKITKKFSLSLSLYHKGTLRAHSQKEAVFRPRESKNFYDCPLFFDLFCSFF